MAEDTDKFFERTNQKVVDRFTIAHAGIGVFFGSMRLGFIPSLTYHLAFELLENKVLKKHKLYQKLFPNLLPDTLANSAGDTLAMLAGWATNTRDVLVPGERLIGKWIPLQSPVPELRGKPKP